jgi:hypothetical protein
MYLVQIFLPRADNSDEPFPREVFDRAKEELAQRYDGVTAYLQAPAEGLWGHGANKSDDNIILFEVMAEEIDLQEWSARRTEYEQCFRQKRILIRYMAIAVV